MQKKYNILTFSDVAIPSYERPYRGVLFVDYAPMGQLNKVFTISPRSDKKFENSDIHLYTKYFSANRFKENQYSVIYRVLSLTKLFFRLVQFRLFNSEKIDFIRTGGSYLSFLLLLTQKRKTPYFADFCDFYFDLYKEFKMPFASIISPIIFFFEKIAIRRASLLFVDTAAQRDFLVKNMGIKKEICVVVPNGVITSKFPYKEERDINILNKYGFNKKDIILFYGGDISEMDGVEMIIDFIKDHPEIPLKGLIIGKGNKEYIENMKGKIMNDEVRGKVIIDSFKPYKEVYKYISVADVCLSPFRITPTSNTVECGKIITYLLGGKKVLSTRADGVQSLYKDMIEYFEDGDYQDFSEKLLSVIQQSKENSERIPLRMLGEKFEFRKIIEYEYMLINKYRRDPYQDFSQYDYM